MWGPADASSPARRTPFSTHVPRKHPPYPAIIGANPFLVSCPVHAEARTITSSLCLHNPGASDQQVSTCYKHVSTHRPSDGTCLDPSLCPLRAFPPLYQRCVPCVNRRRVLCELSGLAPRTRPAGTASAESAVMPAVCSCVAKSYVNWCCFLCETTICPV
jgi:hypothetical protein